MTRLEYETIFHDLISERSLVNSHLLARLVSGAATYIRFKFLCLLCRIPLSNPCYHFNLGIHSFLTHALFQLWHACERDHIIFGFHNKPKDIHSNLYSFFKRNSLRPIIFLKIIWTNSYVTSGIFHKQG